jgi:hypothetical protein
MKTRNSIADILGPWVDSDWDSGLIDRCKRAWNKPLTDLTNEELATLLRQNIATEGILPIADDRIRTAFDDNTEIYDGELVEAANARRKSSEQRIPPKARGREDWPAFVMGRRAILRWTHPDGKHRAYVIARDDDHFMKWSEFFSDDEFENCWIAEDMGGSFYNSEATAIREVHGAFPWTQELQPERRAAEQDGVPNATTRR